MVRKQGLLGILPEPAADVAAQVGAVADPRSGKTAALVPAGTKTPPGLATANRPEGKLVTKSPQLAKQFAKGRASDAQMAKHLGYPETKRQALASGAPRVVQGRTPTGAVAHESVASPAGTRAAVRAAAKATPGGHVVVTSPLAALFRRAAMNKR